MAKKWSKSDNKWCNYKKVLIIYVNLLFYVKVKQTRALGQHTPPLKNITVRKIGKSGLFI